MLAGVDISWRNCFGDDTGILHVRKEGVEVGFDMAMGIGRRMRRIPELGQHPLVLGTLEVCDYGVNSVRDRLSGNAFAATL